MRNRGTFLSFNPGRLLWSTSWFDACCQAGHRSTPLVQEDQLHAGLTFLYQTYLTFVSKCKDLFLANTEGTMCNIEGFERQLQLSSRLCSLSKFCMGTETSPRKEVNSRGGSGRQRLINPKALWVSSSIWLRNQPSRDEQSQHVDVRQAK